MKPASEFAPPTEDGLWDMEAVVFDMDGVVTDTARAHATAWAEMFNGFLAERDAREGESLHPFNDDDYLGHVDGKPRYDGARSFLESRGIELPMGDPADSADEETVCGLGNRKNRRFLELLREGGAEPYETTVRLIEQLRDRGIAIAIITSSRNAEEVLSSAGVSGLFEVKVDGVDAERLGLTGKPEPDIFLEAARRLSVRPEQCAVVEDAISGVAAGHRGGFGLVIGVDRGDHADELLAGGADVVVSDLGDLIRPCAPGDEQTS